MSALVRAASATDAEAIARHRVRLFRGLLAPERAEEAERFFAPTVEMLREVLTNGTTLAWVSDDREPAASLVMHLVRRLPSLNSATGREGYINHVFVDESRRGAGLGMAMLAIAEAAARERGLSRIRLHAV